MARAILGSIYRQLRETINLTQSEMAREYSRLTQPYISQVELGEIMPPLGFHKEVMQLVRLADADVWFMPSDLVMLEALERSNILNFITYNTGIEIIVNSDLTVSVFRDNRQRIVNSVPNLVEALL